MTLWVDPMNRGEAIVKKSDKRKGRLRTRVTKIVGRQGSGAPAHQFRQARTEEKLAYGRIQARTGVSQVLVLSNRWSGPPPTGRRVDCSSTMGRGGRATGGPGSDTVRTMADDARCSY